MGDRGLIDRIDAYLDEVPRAAADVSDHGSLRLFLATGPWPYHARPRPGHGPVTARDVGAVRARQRSAGAPERLEWIAERAGEAAAAAQESGLAVQSFPLLVLEHATAPPPRADGVAVRLLGPDDRSLAAMQAAVAVAFAAPGTARGPAGVREREHEQAAADPRIDPFVRHQLRAGHAVIAVAEDDRGPLAGGTALPRGDVAELVGVATLPCARRRGLAGQVIGALLAELARRGVRTAFIGAADDDVARIYERAGFRRVATACEAAPRR